MLKRFLIAFVAVAFIGVLSTMSSVYIGGIGLEGKDQLIILTGNEKAYARMERHPAIWDRISSEEQQWRSSERLEEDRGRLIPELENSALSCGLFGLAGYAIFAAASHLLHIVRAKSTQARRTAKRL